MTITQIDSSTNIQCEVYKWTIKEVKQLNKEGVRSFVELCFDHINQWIQKWNCVTLKIQWQWIKNTQNTMVVK